MEQADLAAWLIEECERRNLSWAEASRRAKVAPNTISQIVNGTPAGPSRLSALAEFFDTPIERVYQMAGLLPTPPADNHHRSARLLAAADRIMQKWDIVEALGDNEGLDHLIHMAEMQAEMGRLAAEYKARLRDDEDDTEIDIEDTERERKHINKA